MLVHIEAKNLAFLVDANDTVGCLVLCGNKYGLARDMLHVYKSPRFEAIKMNKTIFCHEVYYTVLA